MVSNELFGKVGADEENQCEEPARISQLDAQHVLERVDQEVGGFVVHDPFRVVERLKPADRCLSIDMHHLSNRRAVLVEEVRELTRVQHLVERGLYTGPLDFAPNPELIEAIRRCVVQPDCDPLPSTEP